MQMQDTIVSLEHMLVIIPTLFCRVDLIGIEGALLYSTLSNKSSFLCQCIQHTKMECFPFVRLYIYM